MIGPDAYLCTAYPVEDEEYYIYKFEALANAATAHHMLLYGCDGEPLSTESIWDCPGMCKNGWSTIMFAWAKNAPPTVLHKGVALRVGKNTSIKTIVLQVHYAKIFKDSEPTDHSGLKIYTTFQNLWLEYFFWLVTGFKFHPKCHAKLSQAINTMGLIMNRQRESPMATRTVH
ncbi:probable peptidylglycine alpha-hydroxylating monooxygenase 1 isoform X3 [Biomphalaria glabrata]|uniref:peptidylglycine monooxygenase n=1 Tax=Biomphalaria glabrata TaxID=6526 RepID=A0A9W2YGJ9_BIOGL|nr:probable peptidylglycine alpha-hydroxylating monooxygenase 1 isoform X3 [Biomphalaria glabrata]